MRIATMFSTDEEIINFLKDIVAESGKVHDGGNVWASHGTMRGHIMGLISSMQGRADFQKHSRQEVRELSEYRRRDQQRLRAMEPSRDA
jgi:hypothetical protein